MQEIMHKGRYSKLSPAAVAIFSIPNLLTETTHNFTVKRRKAADAPQKMSSGC